LGAGFWGRLSDKVGRKPILLTGLAGTGISMLMFGFAPNLPVALLARAVGGALNGNIGVLQTTVNEVVKVEAHQPRAYAIMPTVWCMGAFIGAGLGGSLADPVKNYPTIFRPGTIFETFPYLFTNLVCTGVVVFSMVVGVLFLEETHEDLKDKKDVGLEIGKWILAPFVRKTAERVSCNKRGMGEETMCLIDEQPPDYASTASSPALLPTSVSGLPPPAYRSIDGTPRTSTAQRDPDVLSLAADADVEQQSISEQERLDVKHAFTKQVLLNITGFGILA
jgi:MFS family permease